MSRVVAGLGGKLARASRWVFPRGKLPSDPVPGDGRKRIVFLKRGKFSFINEAVAALLAREFPEYRLAELDLFEDLLPGHPLALAGCWGAAAAGYGGDWVRGARGPADCLQRTPGYVRAVRRIVRERLVPWRGSVAFTFQTQALFDGSLEGVPHFLYTDHTHLANLDYPAFDPAKLFRAEWIDAEREIYRAADRVFLMSGHVRETLRVRYALPEEKGVTVFAGSNVGEPDGPLDPGRFARGNILFVGVDWERKGGPEMLEAFRRVRGEFPGATLTVVGCSPDVAEAGVEIAGRVPPERAKRFFAGASIFCLPSRIEPFGIAVVEACAHGLPVVATRIGALRDMVEEGGTGHLVAPGDVAGLAAAFRDLLADPAKCAAFGERGRREIAGRYSWEATGKRIGGIIRERLADRQRAGGGV